jgi:competence ComEA-like helix-hairpin-helix protein
MTRVVHFSVRRPLMFIVAPSLAPVVPLVLALAVLASPAAASDPTEKSQPIPKSTPLDKDHSAKDHPVRVREPHHNGADKHHDEKININTADVKELMSLTGVGRKVAEKIVEYRDSHGPFKKADELKKVEGVGNGVWEKNRDRVVTK